MVVIALQTQDNGTPGRAIQKVLHRLPKGGQVWVKHTAPGNLDIRDALSAHHFIKDQQHLGVDNAAEQQFLQQPAPREEMDQVIEQLLRFIIAGAVDDALGIDDAVESAQGVESALLKREQAWAESGNGGHTSILLGVHLSHKNSSFVNCAEGENCVR